MNIFTDLPLDWENGQLKAALDVISNVYVKQTDIDALIARIGFRNTDFNFKQSPNDYWKEIFSEAVKVGRLESFFRSVCAGPKNPVLEPIEEILLARDTILARCQAVIAGPPNAELPVVMQLHNRELLQGLRNASINVQEFGSSWAISERYKREIQLVGTGADKAMLITPCDFDDMKYYLKHRVIESALENVGRKTQNITIVLWCRSDRHDDIANLLALYPDSNVKVLTGQTSEIIEWACNELGAPLNGRGHPCPFFGFQQPDIDYSGTSEIEDIVDTIVKAVTEELRKRGYRPPILEPIRFTEDEQLENLMNKLVGYPCGIIAIHNMNLETDEIGALPGDFVDRIRAYDEKIEDVGQRCEGLRLNKFIRLGIVLTNKPRSMLYQTPKGNDRIIGKWRFIPVDVSSNTPVVSLKHLAALRGEFVGVARG